MKSASANVFLDLLTMLALSDELRTLDASAQVERAAPSLRRWKYAQPGVPLYGVGAPL